MIQIDAPSFLLLTVRMRQMFVFVLTLCFFFFFSFVSLYKIFCLHLSVVKSSIILTLHLVLLKELIFLIQEILGLIASCCVFVSGIDVSNPLAVNSKQAVYSRLLIQFEFNINQLFIRVF